MTVHNEKTDINIVNSRRNNTNLAKPTSPGVNNKPAAYNTPSAETMNSNMNFNQADHNQKHTKQPNKEPQS